MKWNPADSNSSFVFFISLLTALGGLLFGFNTGIISNAIGMIQEQFHLTSTMSGFVISALLIGACIGALTGGVLSNWMGRRRLLISAAWLFIVGILLSALSPHIESIIIARMIVGFAVGIVSFTVPVYIAEIAPPEYRGMLVTLNQLMITIGIVSSYIIDFDFAAKAEWRMMFGTGLLPAGFFLVCMLFVPESPRWLVMQGLDQHAEKILTWLRGGKNIHYEMHSIRESQIDRHSILSLLKKPSILTLLMMGIGLAILQQFSGINTIIYFAPRILKSVGFETTLSLVIATLGIGLVNVLFTLLAIPLIDWIGRRPLLMIGTLGMAISLFSLATAFDASTRALTIYHGLVFKWTAFGSLIAFIIFFAMSLGPMLWLIISEVFPLEIRSLGAALSSATVWITNIIIVTSFFKLIHLLTPAGTCILYAFICLLGFLFIYFVIPETKGVSLEQIETNIKARRGCRYLGTAKIEE